MRIPFKTLIFAFLLFIGNGLFAQARFSGWAANFSTISLNDRFSVHFDGQWRSTNQLQKMQTLLLRGGINYKVTQKLIATGGYAYIHNYRSIGGITGYSGENRFWEQLIYNQKLSPGASLAHRLRFEQRLIDMPQVVNGNLEKNATEFASRIRYFFRAIIPLEKQLSGFNKGWFTSLQNEIFINLGDKSVVNNKYFDQNRAYASIGYRLNPKCDVEMGYMNQYSLHANDAFTNNHILQIASYLRL